MGRFIYITVGNAGHEQEKVGPKVAKPVNEVPSPDLAKKRGHDNDGKYQQQEANKDQGGVNGEQYQYEPGYITHISAANITGIYCL